jgi:hypothetical protein
VVPLSVAATRNLHVAVERMRDASLGLVGAWLRPDDPHGAVCELYGPREHDQISVSTLETCWLRMELPRRVHGTTGAVLTHASAKGACRTC